MINGIFICGLNGAGKTTLAGELARLTGFKQMDIEDYFFLPSDIPYTRSRTKEECNKLILADIKKHPKFVLSAVIGDFGNEIIGRFDAVVIVDVPREIRMERVKKRDFDRFGNRVLAGGDLYEQQLKFYKKVDARSENYVENWIKTLSCPVIRVDGTSDYSGSANAILSAFRTG
jgi:adenylate kinase family enzyme